MKKITSAEALKSAVCDAIVEGVVLDAAALESADAFSTAVYEYIVMCQEARAIDVTAYPGQDAIAAWFDELTR